MDPGNEPERKPGKPLPQLEFQVNRSDTQSASVKRSDISRLNCTDSFELRFSGKSLDTADENLGEGPNH